jgi:predicted nucleic acid-binding protein
LIVVDASVIVDLLLRRPGIESLVARLFRDPAWNAPHLIDLEIGHVLRRWVLMRKVSASRAEVALDIMQDLPIHRWPHQILMSRIWRLRENLTVYDAAYVALAEALGCALVTRDRRLASVRGVKTAVEHL